MAKNAPIETTALPTEAVNPAMPVPETAAAEPSPAAKVNEPAPAPAPRSDALPFKKHGVQPLTLAQARKLR